MRRHLPLISERAFLLRRIIPRQRCSPATRSAVGDARRELLAVVGEAMEIVYVRRTFGAGHLGLGPLLGA